MMKMYGILTASCLATVARSGDDLFLPMDQTTPPPPPFRRVARSSTMTLMKCLDEVDDDGEECTPSDQRIYTQQAVQELMALRVTTTQEELDDLAEFAREFEKANIARFRVALTSRSVVTPGSEIPIDDHEHSEQETIEQVLSALNDRLHKWWQAASFYLEEAGDLSEPGDVQKVIDELLAFVLDSNEENFKKLIEQASFYLKSLTEEAIVPSAPGDVQTVIDNLLAFVLDTTHAFGDEEHLKEFIILLDEVVVSMTNDFFEDTKNNFWEDSDENSKALYGQTWDHYATRVSLNTFASVNALPACAAERGAEKGKWGCVLHYDDDCFQGCPWCVNIAEVGGKDERCTCDAAHVCP